MAKLLDFTGQRFGRLTAVSFSHIDRHQKRCWLWQCDCGTQKTIVHSLVRSGKISSCGCLASELTTKRFAADITGQRFGRLVALKPTGAKRHGTNVEWMLQCDCGTIVHSTVHSLRGGNTTSCGCYLKDRIAETQRHDLTGQRFGSLTAVRFSHSVTKANGTKGQAYWVWRCDCGQELQAPGAGVRNRFLATGAVSCMACAKKRMAAKTSHDLTGQRFGMLVALKRVTFNDSPAHSRWLWQCDCGQQCTRLASNVKASRNANCGCSSLDRSADRTGERFGSLVALEKIGLDKAGKTYVWRFQCDCGNTCEARLRDAVSGLQQSCGCRQGGYDSVRAWIDGQFRGADQDAVFYVFPLAHFDGYAKPGISADLASRVRASRGHYGPVHDFIELPRLDAWLLEQAVLRETRALADCPQELVEASWEGYSEVRRTTCDALFDLALQLHDQMQELGKPAFAIRHLILTPHERKVLATMDG